MNPDDLIKQTSAATLVIGVCRNHQHWENLACNHILKHGKFYRLTDGFGYFLCRRGSFIKGVAAAIRADEWLAGQRNSDDTYLNNVLDWRKAKNLLDKIEETPFYRRMFGETRWLEELEEPHETNWLSAAGHQGNFDRP